mmetsp:Transcript_9479/g.27033  ORF Transcript_9479/g.27033 Transcript_9479/m.27033 type:complete len:300 (-) Transcript_9479:2315-3214(-)
MDVGDSSCRSSTDRPPDEAATFLVFVNVSRGRHDSWVGVRVSSHVLGFLLCPNHFCVVVFGAALGDAVKCKRCDLFQPDQRDIVHAALLALGEQLVVDLARAEHQLLDLFWVAADGLVRFIEDTVEHGSRSHVLQGRHATLVAKQILGRNHDERLAELAMDLTSQTVKVVGRGRAVHNLPVVVLDLHALVVGHLGDEMGILINLLQESFQAAAGVLGALSVVSMREQHHQTRLSQPLVFSAGNELIDDGLGAIDEVTELRFPQNESVRVFQTVPRLESQNGEFGQDGVTARESGLGVTA